MTPLPRPDLCELMLAQGEAQELARAGLVQEGYQLLLDGLAAALAAHRTHQPFARELAGCWRGAVELFAEEYGMREER